MDIFQICIKHQNPILVKELSIMLIEDDAIEVMKLHRALKKHPVKHNVIEAGNGEQALEMLKDEGQLPDVIFLDLNMPKMNGIEFLTTLKNDSLIKYIPTVILTTSANLNDVKTCYEIGIAGYIIKPLKYEEYIERILKTVDYWAVNQLYKPL